MRDLLAGRAGGSTGILRKDTIDGIIRTGDHMRTDDFTGLGSGRGSRIECCFDGCDIAEDDGIAQGAAHLFHRTGEFDVCGFEHRVNANDETGEAAGFEKSNCLFGHGSIWFV